jgi:hypothetical protein
MHIIFSFALSQHDRGVHTKRSIRPNILQGRRGFAAGISIIDVIIRCLGLGRIHRP